VAEASKVVLSNVPCHFLRAIHYAVQSMEGSPNKEANALSSRCRKMITARQGVMGNSEAEFPLVIRPVELGAAKASISCADCHKFRALNWYWLEEMLFYSPYPATVTRKYWLRQSQPEIVLTSTFYFVSIFGFSFFCTYFLFFANSILRATRNQ
jgi:hypothetical protein